MPACDGDPCTAAFNSARRSPSSAGGNHHSVQKPAPWGHPLRMPWPIGQYANSMGISFQRLRHCRPTLRQQPYRVPPLSLRWRRCSVHPSPHLSLVHAPPFQQRPHLRHAQQQPPLGFPDPFRLPQPPLSYPNPMRVSPWLWFSTQSRLKWQDDFTVHGQFPSQVPKPCLSATAISRMTEY